MSDYSEKQKAKIKSELEPVNLTALYRDYLNESYGTVSICGYEYEAARALEEVDPTAFRVGECDWADGAESLVEIDGVYYELYQIEKLDLDEEGDS